MRRTKTKVSKNLSLDRAAVERGERFSRTHRTSLSKLVGDFLARLPLGHEDAELTPTVRRLLGAGKGRFAGRTDRQAHREHLHRKYTRTR